MLCALITTEESTRAEEATADGQTVAWTVAASISAAQLDQKLQEAVRAALDILWIDYDAVPQSQALEAADAIRKYRVNRPTTRIIIEKPDDIAPPDLFIASLITIGIYDLVPPTMLFSHALAMPPATYADVARWHVLIEPKDPRDHEKPAKPEAIIRDHVIERKVASTNRPAIIAVRGVLPGSGTTLLTSAIAIWLSAHGWPAALIELKPQAHSDIRAFANRAEKLPPGMIIYPQGTATLEVVMHERLAAYIVCDLGVRLKLEGIAVWPDLELVVLPPVTRWGEIGELTDPNPLRLELRPAVTLPEPNQRVLWWSGSPPTGDVAEKAGHCLPIPVSGWPPVLDTALNRALGQLLVSVRPDIAVPGWVIWLKKHESHLVPWVLAAGFLVVVGLFAHDFAAHGWPSWGIAHHISKLTAHAPLAKTVKTLATKVAKGGKVS